MIRVNQQNRNSVEEWDAIYSTEKGRATTGWNCHSAITVLAAVIPRGAHVLSCACGMGHAEKNTSKRRPDISWSGLDFSAAVVAHQGAHPSVRWNGLHQADIRNLGEASPLRGQSFTTVMALEVLEHLDDPIPVVAAINRLASRQIILSVPYQNRIATAYHVWSIDEPEFRAWLEPYGRVETYIVRHGSKMIGVCDK